MADEAAQARRPARHRHSLATPIFLITGLLGALLTFSVGWQVWNTDQQRSLAIRAQDANRTSDLFLDVARHAALERGRVSQALAAPVPATAAELAAIRAERAQGDAALDRVVRLLTPEQRASGLATATRAAHDAAAALRSEVDRAVALEVNGRDTGLRPAAFAKLTAFIEASQHLRLSTAFTSLIAAAQLASLQQDKHFLWVVSEQAGRERGMIAGLIAGRQPIDIAALSQLAEIRGRINDAWENLSALFGRASTSPAIRVAGAAAQHAYFEAFEQTRAGVYAAGLAGRPYPLSAPEWFAAATRAIGTVGEVARAVSVEAQNVAARDRARAERTLLVASIGLATGLLAVAACMWIIARRVARPVLRMTQAMSALSEGDLDVDVTEAGRQDEIGAMARAVEVFRAQAIENRQMTAAQDAARIQAEEEKRAALRQMADTVESEAASALRAIGQHTERVARTGQAMTQSAEAAGEAVLHARAGSDTTLATSQMAAAAADQLSQSIHEIGRLVGRSTAIVGEAVGAGESTRTAIGQLNDRVGRIGSIADVIGDIAAKTNLLALNATIEAARAGDAGRGFAVVASEVKQLAGQTARSTQEILAQIMEVKAATEATVHAVGRMEGTIRGVDEMAASIAAAVQQQGAATAEIARGVAEAAGAVREVNRQTAHAAETAAEVRGLAGQMQDGTRALSESVQTLRHNVIRTIRTSAADVERRLRARRAIDLPCRVAIQGQAALAGRIVDLSEEGAQARVAGLGVQVPGGTGRLMVDAIDCPLDFIIRGAERDALRVQFRTDEAGRAAVSRFLATVDAQAA